MGNDAPGYEWHEWEKRISQVGSKYKFVHHRRLLTKLTMLIQTETLFSVSMTATIIARIGAIRAAITSIMI